MPIRNPYFALPVIAAALFSVSTTAALAGPPGAVGDLYVPSGDTHSVKQFDGVTGAAAGTFVPTGSGGLNNPVGIAFGPSGNLFVTSYNNDQVIQYDGNAGALIGTFGIGGGLDGPYGMAFGTDGNLYACSFLNARIVRFDGSTGAALGTFATGGGLGSPLDLTFGTGGDLFVASSSGTKILRYNGATGAFVSTFASGGGLSGLGGIAFGPNGNLFVASFNNNQIIQFDGTTGAAIGIFASGGGLSGPFGITFGNDGNLYVGSYNNNKVLRYSGTTGAFIDTFVASVSKPGHLRFKQASGPFPAPNITGFVPGASANCGPTAATVSGTGFATGIGFKLKRAGQTDISGAITALSETQASVNFNLAGAALGLWDIEARYPDSQSSTLASVLDLTLCTPPTVTGISPGSASNCGPLSGAVISGADFLAGATVKLSRAGQSDIPGTSVVVTPPGTITANFATTGAAAGAWDVTVTNAGGSGSHTLVGALTITVCPPPSVSGINPGSVTNCGALTGATISGGNFLFSATVKLAKGGQSDIPGTSVVVIPPGTVTANFATTSALAGAWDVVVTNPGGSGIGSLAGALNINACPAPIVSSINPNAASNCGALAGASISGSNFLSGATVKLSKSGQTDIAGTGVVVTPPGTITANFATTGAATDAWDVVVTNPGASGSGSLAGGLNISVCAPPSVMDFAPHSTTWPNCSTLRYGHVIGAGFLEGATVKLSRSGQPDIVGTAVYVNSATSIDVSFLPHGAAPGLWDLTVTNPGASGSGTLPNAVGFASCPAPTLSTLYPPQATNCRPLDWYDPGYTGGVIFIGQGIGSDFSARLRRSGFPDIVMPYTGEPSGYDFDEQWARLNLPVTNAAPGSWDLVITNQDGQSATLPGALELSACPPPIVTSVSPGGVLGSVTGQSLQIFASDPIFGTAPSTVTLRHAGTPDIVTTANFSDSITARIPGGPIIGTLNLAGAVPGDYDVILTRADGQSNTMPHGFRIVADQGLTPTVIANWGGPVKAVVVDPANPNIAYIGSGRRLVILDVSNPAAGVPEIGSIDLGNCVMDVKVRDGWAFAATRSRPNYVNIIDVSNPAAPHIAWSYTQPYSYNAAEVQLWGNQMFVRENNNIDVWDVSVFTNHQSNPVPVSLGRVVQSVASKIEISGNQLYMLDSNLESGTYGNRVWIYDLTVPWTPQYVNNSKLHCVGITQLSAANVGGGQAMAVGGDMIYAAASQDDQVPRPRSSRFAIIDAASIHTPNPDDQPVVLHTSTNFSWIGRGTFSEGTSHGIAVSGSYVYIADPEIHADGGEWEPPLNGRGLAIFDVSNPTSPSLVGQLRTHGQVNGVTLSGSRAYVVNGEGIEIVDVSNPVAPAVIGRYHSPANIRNVAQDGSLLYVSDDLFGMTILDVSNPRRPDVVGTFHTPLNGLHHDSWDCVVDSQRSIAFLSAGFSGVYALNVSDPAHPTTIGNLAYPSGSRWSGRGIAMTGSMLHLGIVLPAGGGLFYNIDADDPQAMSPRGGIGFGLHPPTTICARSDEMLFAGTSYDGVAATDFKIIDSSIVDVPTEVLSSGTDHPDVALVGMAQSVLAVVEDDNDQVLDGLSLLNVSNLQSPLVISHFAIPRAVGVSVLGSRAYVVGYGTAADTNTTFHVLDISHPASPIRIAKAFIQGALRVRTDPRGFAYVTAERNDEGHGGLAIVDVREGPAGDINNDGSMTPADVQGFVQALLSGGEPFFADLNGDGHVDGRDVQSFIAALLTAPTPVPEMVGACCGMDGVCHEGVTPFSCMMDFNGTYQGDNTTCATATCPPVGSCCLPFGSQPCAIRTQAACAAAGGTYGGNGSTCETVACRGACCNALEGTCTERSSAACALAQNNYQGDGTTCATSSCPFGRYLNQASGGSAAFLPAGPNLTLADDMTLAGTGARELSYLSLVVYGNGGGPFSVYVELFPDCPWPAFPIPDTSFVWENVPDDGFAHILIVDPAPPGIILPDTVWMSVSFSTPEAGWLIPGQAQIGSTEDRYGTLELQSDFCNAGFSNVWAGFWAELRCKPQGTLIAPRGAWSTVQPGAESRGSDIQHPTSDAGQFVEHKGRQFRVGGTIKKLDTAVRPSAVERRR